VERERDFADAASPVLVDTNANDAEAFGRQLAHLPQEKDKIRVLLDRTGVA
jgi:hypothetical protein